MVGFCEYTSFCVAAKDSQSDFASITPADRPVMLPEGICPRHAHFGVCMASPPAHGALPYPLRKRQGGVEPPAGGAVN